MRSRYPFPASENHAICFPSGDQTGVRSAAPGLRVRFRGSPFSTGTVKMSPRAAKRARFPVGESAAAAIDRPTSVQRGAAQGKSPWTLISTGRSAPVAGSSSWIVPFCSMTRVPPPAESDFTSASLNRVTWRTVALPTS